MTKVRGHICIRRKAKDGSPGSPGEAGKSIRTTVWESGKQYYAGDTQVDGVYPLDIVSDKAMAIGTSGVNFYMCIRSHTSSSGIPLTNTSYWSKLNNLKPVVTYLILAEAIKANLIDVQDLAAATAFVNALTANNTFTETLAATTAFINKLLATSAFIDNLSVKHLSGADGMFSGKLAFPFENLSSDNSTLTDSDVHYVEIHGTQVEYGTYYRTLKKESAASIRIPESMRYVGSTYQSYGRVQHITLPSDMPTGVVINILAEGINYKSIMRTVHIHAERIYYTTEPETYYYGRSILFERQLRFPDVFFLRLMHAGNGNYYVIQVLGQYQVGPEE